MLFFNSYLLWFCGHIEKYDSCWSMILCLFCHAALLRLGSPMLRPLSTALRTQNNCVQHSTVFTIMHEMQITLLGYMAHVHISSTVSTVHAVYSYTCLWRPLQMHACFASRSYSNISCQYQYDLLGHIDVPNITRPSTWHMAFLSRVSELVRKETPN